MTTAEAQEMIAGRLDDRSEPRLNCPPEPPRLTVSARILLKILRDAAATR